MVGGLGLVVVVGKGLIRLCSKRRLAGERVRDGTAMWYKREDQGV